MPDPKSKELIEASRIRSAKQELLDVIFKKGVLDLDLVPIKPQNICSVCNDPSPAARKKRECAKCECEKRTPCRHFNGARNNKLRAFDLCAASLRPSYEDGAEDAKASGRKAKTNMDIYSAQRLASERAKALFDRLEHRDCISAIRQYQRDCKKIDKDLKLDFGDEYRENRLVQIVLVGASVTGLAFHATLVELLKGHPILKSFHELFMVTFVDLHMRPLERLMQSRDRTVVPRFEYERLLNTPIKLGKERHNGRLVVQTPEFLSEPAARRHWKKTHTLMPTKLRWSPGTARSVAEQIAKGHETWLKTAEPKGKMAGLHAEGHYDHVFGHMSSWFLGVRPPKGDEEDRPEEKELRMFGVGLYVYEAGILSGNEKDYEVRKRPVLYGDILFKATGLGIDISGDQASELKQRPNGVCGCGKKKKGSDFGPVFDFPSVQRSYWDPIKPELDLPEEKSNHILVVGNSDAAAGAIFASLLKELNSCTFRVLADLLWRCGEDDKLTAVQRWFLNLQKRVKKLVKNDPEYRGLSITQQWIKALHRADIQFEMFDPKYAIEDELEDHLRSFRALCVGLRWGDADETLWNQFKSEYDEYDTEHLGNISPERGYLAKKFMSDAWPENRLLAILIRSRLTVLRLNYGVGEKAPFDITRQEQRKKTTYLLSGDVSHVPFVGERNDMSGIEYELKYVLNCGGPPYFQHDGNAIVRPSKKGKSAA